MRPVPGTQCSDVNCHHRRLENRQGEKKLGKNRKLLKVLKLKKHEKTRIPPCLQAEGRSEGGRPVRRIRQFSFLIEPAVLQGTLCHRDQWSRAALCTAYGLSKSSAVAQFSIFSTQILEWLQETPSDSWNLLNQKALSPPCSRHGWVLHAGHVLPWDSGKGCSPVRWVGSREAKVCFYVFRIHLGHTQLTLSYFLLYDRRISKESILFPN